MDKDKPWDIQISIFYCLKYLLRVSIKLINKQYISKDEKYWKTVETTFHFFEKFTAVGHSPSQKRVSVEIQIFVFKLLGLERRVCQ